MTVGAPKIDTIGQFEMAVEPTEPSPEAAARWAQRSEALTAWLLAEWRREHPEAA
jgi:hypothetical protein